MKTTIDLPEELLREAKATAARRGITLRAMLMHALEREVQHRVQPETATFVVDANGLPHLPARGASITRGLVDRLMDEDLG